MKCKSSIYVHSSWNRMLQRMEITLNAPSKLHFFACLPEVHSKWLSSPVGPSAEQKLFCPHWSMMVQLPGEAGGQTMNMRLARLSLAVNCSSTWHKMLRLLSSQFRTVYRLPSECWALSPANMPKPRCSCDDDDGDQTEDVNKHKNKVRGNRYGAGMRVSV